VICGVANRGTPGVAEIPLAGWSFFLFQQTLNMEGKDNSPPLFALAIYSFFIAI
jgi:hypothetical protein